MKVEVGGFFGLLLLIADIWALVNVIGSRSRYASGHYEARDGQVYSLEATPDGVSVDVGPDPRRAQIEVAD